MSIAMKAMILFSVLLLAMPQFCIAGEEETLRPQIHYTPPANWMNDPNGLIRVGDEYHLFYQYNPQGIRWGHMSWGHAVSTDLLHWRTLPLALGEDANGMIFSGSAVYDADNTSGLGTGDNPPMVAIYTQATREKQAQAIAYSLDKGRSWQKYAGNPVLDPGLKNFRDPKVLWYAPDRTWIMVVALSTEKRLAFFRSPDLVHWTHLSDFGPAGAADGIWECPDLFLMPVANRPGQSRWLLKVDAQNSKIAPGGGGQVFVGEFNGKTFVPESGKAGAPIWLDYGPDFYASNSWAGLAADRQVIIGWMDNWDYARDVPTHPWRGEMSIPRDLHLRAEGDHYVLQAEPTRELARLAHDRMGPYQLSQGGTASLDLPDPTSARDINLQLHPGRDGRIALTFKSDEGLEAEIRYDRDRQTLSLYRRGYGTPDDSTAPCATMPLAPDSTDLRILLDRTSLEIFAQNGTRVMSARLLPRAPISTLSLVSAQGGTATVVTALLYPTVEALP